MNRRNFIGNLMAIGAGFIILPSAVTHSRIWVPSRKIITDTLGSVWRDFYVSYRLTEIEYGPDKKPSLGAVVKHNGNLWYGTPVNWLRLEKFEHPLTWPVTSTDLTCERQALRYPIEVEMPAQFETEIPEIG